MARKLDDAELARKSLELRVRAEASIVRLRWLNEVLPAVLQEFDRRLTAGESVKLELPSIDAVIEEAIDGIGG